MEVSAYGGVCLQRCLPIEVSVIGHSTVLNRFFAGSQEGRVDISTYR